MEAGVLKFFNLGALFYGTDNFKLITLFFTGVVIFISCKKEILREGCADNNKIYANNSQVEYDLL